MTTTDSAQVRDGQRDGERVFGHMQGHVISTVFSALERNGTLDQLAEKGVRAADLGENGYLARATLRYLAERDIVRAGEDGLHRLTGFGRQLYKDRGYLVWLSGGYGEALHHYGDLLSGRRKFGEDVDRDVRWVAVGTALAGQEYLRPQVMDIVSGISFGKVADLGCGNGRFLIGLCRAGDAEGIGVDISPDAVAEAENEVAAAGLGDRVSIVRGDAREISTVPGLEDVQLVVTFFFLHEVLEAGREVLVGYLGDMAKRLPAGARLLTAEIVPPLRTQNVDEVLTPEYSLTQALMEQRLQSEEEWREVFSEGGFEVEQMVRADLPDCRIILARTVG